MNGRDTIHFNADSSNTELSGFAHFIQQIRPASTEQSQAGVKSSAESLRIRKSRLRIIGRLETDCEKVFRDLEHWRKKSNLREFVKMRHYGEGSPLG